MNKSELIKLFSKFWLVFFPIASYYFYRYVGFNEQLSKAIYFIALPITILFVFSELNKNYKHKLYASLVRYIFLLMCFSMLMSFLFWGQGFLLSYRSLSLYLALIYFFFLMKSKPDLIYLEKIIWFFCILYLVLWIYGLFKAPELVFGIEKESGMNDSRGIFRLSISGKAFVVLGFFVALNKYVETKKTKWKTIFVLLFSVIVMHVIRQVIVFSFLIALYYLLRNNRYLWLLLGFVVIVFFGISNIKIEDKTIIGKLINLSDNQYNQQKSGEENTRITEYKYYFTSYSKNLVTVLFGNGVSHSDGSFGKHDLKIATEKGIYASDVGYAEIFIRFGLVGLILYGFIFYRVIKQKVPAKFMYAKLFLLYILFANIAASWVFQDIIVICICLYILESCHRKTSIRFLKQNKISEIANRKKRIQNKLSCRTY